MTWMVCIKEKERNVLLYGRKRIDSHGVTSSLAQVATRASQLLSK